MILIQGLSFLALVFRFARVRAKMDRCVSRRLELSAVAIFSIAPLTTSAQQQPEAPGKNPAFSIAAERLEQLAPLRPNGPQLTYQVRDQLIDNFDRRSLEFYVIREYMKNIDAEAMREDYAKSTKRRVERSFTRSIVRAVENTAFVTRLREEPWKERIFNILKDAFTEDAPTIGTPLSDEDPHVDYDVEKPVLQKPAWKDAVSFFVRPFSLHPNVGVGLKVDGIRAEIKAYHDELKFSACKPITDTWSLYSSARMKEFTPQETSFSFGFQHTFRCLPATSTPAVFQYGVSVRNDSLFDKDRGRTFHQFRPHAFLAFVFDY